MKKILIITIALLAFAGFNSCVETTTSGSQATQVTSASKTVKMKPFVDVNVIGSMQVLYSTGKSNEVRVEAMKEAFDKLVIYVKENELYITSKDENLDSASLIQDVKVYVSSPSLREVSLTGAGSFITTGPVSSSHLDIDLIGAGEVAFAQRVDTKTLDVELTGAGVVNISDLKCPKLWTQITGAGTVNYDNITIDNAESIIVGSGKVSMKGSVKNHIKTITGSGVISESSL